MANKEFKILSIDGGGVRGIYPTQYLALIEQYLKEKNKEQNINKYFDLICGTSTGGIIAIGLGLGISASELNKFYLENASKIFSQKRCPLFKSKYDNKTLESLIKKTYKDISSSEKDPLLGDSATRLCIPAFDAYSGKVNIFKTSHHEDLHIDYKIPAYQVAMATSAAPTFFDPYLISYTGMSENNISKPVNIDGGIFANNPTMIAILEAVSLGYNLNEIKVLSIGTCRRIFKEVRGQKKWGYNYWFRKANLFDVMLQSQSMAVENQVKILNKGIGLGTNNLFKYQRIQYEFHDNNSAIELDESKIDQLKNLNFFAQDDYKHKGKETIDLFFENTVEKFQPIHNIKQ